MGRGALLGDVRSVSGDHLASIALLFLLHLLAHPIGECAKRKKASTRWFAVHALANLVVGYLAERAYVGGEATTFPLCIVVWLHVYHILFYELTTSDWYHHLVFLPTIAVPGLMYDWGLTPNLQLVFICGYPGFILYSCIVVNRCTSVRIDLALVSALVNVLVRAPGILMANALLFAERPPKVPLVFLVLQLTLAPVNAIYYACDSVWKCSRPSGRSGTSRT